ncbi:MAG TPA: 6-phosphofructokinase [Clostridia bacterium]|nr:6-phosphofructokinase [Clostridia bacterium]
MRLGILNGGGDAPGLNAVIRSAVRTAIHRYGFEIIGFRNGFKGVIENDYLTFTDQSVSGILHRGGTILGTTNRDNPFNYRGRDVSDRAADHIKKLGLDGLLVVGGDGTLSIGIDLMERYELPMIGIPKTIDNDLMSTDYTFGFQTAVQTAVNACDILHTTAESHHRAMILEVMGRNAGWIALHAGLAGGADVILIPEIPFTLEGICRKIEERRAMGKQFSIIVMAEGISLPPGSACRVDGAGMAGGKAGVLATMIEDRTGIEARATVLGHLQRGGTPIAYDRILGTRLGCHAVELAANKDFGRLVVLRGDKVCSVPLSKQLKEQRLIDPDHDLIKTARSIGISFGE